MPYLIGHNTREIKGISYRDGDIVDCTIENERGRFEIPGSIIHISSEGRAFICSDEVGCSGSIGENLFGRSYSWAYDENVKHISKPIEGLETKPITFCDKLKIFFQSCDVNTYFSYYKVGIHDNYDRISATTNPGFIKAANSSNRRFIEIKLGRFVRQLASKYDEIQKNEKYKCNFTDQFIEELHNKYVAFQSGELYDLEILNGEDILEGYKMDNYVPGGGTLGNSCMTNKLSYLDLYTKNPNQVSLAVIRFQDRKVAARAIVWTDDDGNKLFDRIYHRYDWLDKIMSDQLEKKGISNIRSSKFVKVRLEKWDFDYYPYVDTMYMFDKDKGHLYGTCEGLRTLRRTDGGF